MLLFISEMICNSNAVIRQDFRKLRFQMIDDNLASLPESDQRRSGSLYDEPR